MSIYLGLFYANRLGDIVQFFLVFFFLIFALDPTFYINEFQTDLFNSLMGP